MFIGCCQLNRHPNRAGMHACLNCNKGGPPSLPKQTAYPRFQHTKYNVMCDGSLVLRGECSKHRVNWLLHASCIPTPCTACKQSSACKNIFVPPPPPSTPTMSDKVCSSRTTHRAPSPLIYRPFPRGGVTKTTKLLLLFFKCQRCYVP